MPELKDADTSFRSIVKLPFSITGGSLIDFETVGIPGRRTVQDIVTFGYIVGSEVTIVQRKSRDKTRYYELVRQIVNGLPRPFYSNNVPFELSVIKEELSLSISLRHFVNIMEPYKTRAEKLGLNWPKPEELVSEPEDYFKERKVPDNNVLQLWSTFLKTGKRQFLKPIMNHCRSDIMREATILLYSSLQNK